MRDARSGWPEPDVRMARSIGGFDEAGEPIPLTYSSLRAATGAWPVSIATPEGPAERLRVAREMFALSFFCYEILPSAGLWALSAVEGALRIRLGDAVPSPKTPLRKLTALAEELGLLPVGMAGALDAGRELRNRLAHGEHQPVWSLGMAEPVMSTSHLVVATLFPDEE